GRTDLRGDEEIDRVGAVVDRDGAGKPADRQRARPEDRRTDGEVECAAGRVDRGRGTIERGRTGRDAADLEVAERPARAAGDLNRLADVGGGEGPRRRTDD